jgi:SAM-dependent methyltransferase
MPLYLPMIPIASSFLSFSWFYHISPPFPGLFTQLVDIAGKEAERIVHCAGNALTDDLGNEEYDLIFIGNLLHHFDEVANRDLVKRSAHALRPNGYLVIEELHRFQSPREVGELGALSNLYFAATSEAGSWSMQEIAEWQREAGLLPRKPIRLLTAPGAELQAAIKPNSQGSRRYAWRRQSVPGTPLPAQCDLPQRLAGGDRPQQQDNGSLRANR